MVFVTAKKSLGQHFLIDKNIAKKIVDSLCHKDRPVIEVGPGRGVLTEILIEKKFDLYAVEIDQRVVSFLKDKLPYLKKRIIHHNFLKFDISSIFNNKISIIGNFPYNIASQIFFKILENRDIVDDAVCMIQKEMAERICGSPGNKTYGILSVLLQAFYKIEYLFTVSEHVFEPSPKVKSAVIRLGRNDNKYLNCNENLFFRIIKTGFNQRRKTLKNSLKSILLNLDLNNDLLLKRPEQLSFKEFIELTKLIEEKI